MKYFKKVAAAIVCGFAVSALSVHAITLNFAAITNTDINFSGGNFSFTANNAGYQFDITSVSNGVGDSVGLDGYVNPGGPFNIGSITSETNTTFGITEIQQFAPVTGSGILTIVDANGVKLTGSVTWQNIFSAEFTPGSSSVGALDLTGTVNLQNILYSGGSSDLSTLALAGNAVDSISFQFIPEEDLSDLVAANGLATSYSGSIVSGVTPVPEPGTLTLVGIGLVGLLGLRKRQSAK